MNGWKIVGIVEPSPLKRFFVYLDTTSGSRIIIVQSERIIFNQLKPIEILLKFRKIWVAIIPSIITSGEQTKDRWNRWTFSFKTLFRLSRYDFRLPSYLRVKRKVIFNQLKPIEILLKFRKIWVAIIPKVVISGERMKDGWNRWTFFFKTLFHLSRYDFRLPSYRRVKRKVIFNRLLSPS